MIMDVSLRFLYRPRPRVDHHPVLMIFRSW
jgi:hypothetical protein